MENRVIVLRGPQMTALETAYRNSVVLAVAANLRSCSPHTINGLSQAEVQFRVETAVRGTIAYALHEVEDIEAFTRLCFVIGPHFDRYETFRRAFEAAGPGSGFTMTEILLLASPADWRRAAQADILLRCRQTRTAKAEIRIVPLTAMHAESWFEGALHPDVWRLGGMHPPESAAAVRQWIANLQPVDGQRYAIQCGDRFAGSARAWIHADDGALYLSYWVARPLWGHGIATETVRQLLAAISPNAAVRLRIDSGNAPSRRVAEKCGFQLVTGNTELWELRRDG